MKLRDARMSSATTKKERPCGRSLQRLVIGRGLVFRRLRDDGEGAGCRLECVRLAGNESRQRLLRSFATRPESAIRGDAPDRSPYARISAMANQEPLGLRASSAFSVLADGERCSDLTHPSPSSADASACWSSVTMTLAEAISSARSWHSRQSGRTLAGDRARELSVRTGKQW